MLVDSLDVFSNVCAPTLFAKHVRGFNLLRDTNRNPVLSRKCAGVEEGERRYTCRVVCFCVNST